MLSTVPGGTVLRTTTQWRPARRVPAQPGRSDVLDDTVDVAEVGATLRGRGRADAEERDVGLLDGLRQSGGVQRTRPGPWRPARSGQAPRPGFPPDRMASTLLVSTSTPHTSWPLAARHAAVTVPT